MKGADEYCNVFSKPEQIEKLYLLPGSHARGKTFRIYVLPEGENALESLPNAPLNKNTIEVYGAVSGQLGWTEVYGWIYKGKWQEDFQRLFEQRKEEIKIKRQTVKRCNQLKKDAKNKKVSELLLSY